jgi:exopolysaccharide biosynthesis protein/surface antigen
VVPAVLAAVAAAALALAAPAHAQQPATLFPGVTYEQDVQFTPHGPVAIRVVRGPKPVGLYRLRMTLSNETVLGRETVSSMQKRLSSQATMVGVNGDFSRFADGKPSGILLRDGILVAPPNSDRSSVGVGLDGVLDVRRVKFLGTWRGTGQRRAINELNDAPGKNGLALFTSDWGATTPRVSNSYAVVLDPFPPSVPNTDLVAPVTGGARDARVRIAPGTAVLVARGNAAAKLEAEAAVGTSLTLRLILQPDWGTVADAIGGGPVLVRDGKPVYRANEAFEVVQIAPRHPRTAIGQTADGRILLVVVDGRQAGYSVGMTTFEMALTMTRLGAVRAMQLDGGGSSTLAFDGTVLNRPSDGRERPISTALMLQYYGAYVLPPAEEVVSPNGDGVGETQALSYKVVRPSNVTVKLTAPDGTVAFEEALERAPGTYEVPFPPPVPEPPVPVDPTVPPPPPTEPGPLAEGRWTLGVSSLDDQGLGSSAVRRFGVNSTLGFLKVAPAQLVLRRTGGNATVRWTQTRAARVKVTVETIDGVLIRVPATRRLDAGEQAVVWNGRQASGKLAAGGRYVVTVEATNELGTVTLAQELRVRRTAGSKR